MLAPQALDEAVGRDRAADMQREHREHGPLLARAQFDRPVVDSHFAAIGAGGAGAPLLLVSLGGFTYRSRHHDVRILR